MRLAYIFSTFAISTAAILATGYAATKVFPREVYDLTKQCRPLVMHRDCRGMPKGTVIGEECFKLWNRDRDGVGNDTFETLPGMEQFAHPDCRSPEPPPPEPAPAQFLGEDTLKRPN